MYTRKDFVMVAETIHAECASADFDAFNCRSLENVARAFADKFAASNNRFDRDKFLNACGFGA